MSNINPQPEDLRASYEATFAYHHALAQIRFNVLGLFLAGSSFLAAVYFAEKVWPEARIVVALLGFSIAVLMWLLELRTYCMLIGLVELGCSIERSLGLNSPTAFFDLMQRGAQDVPLRLPAFRIPLSNKFHKIIRHSVELELTYFVFGAFWVYCLIHQLCG